MLQRVLLKLLASGLLGSRARKCVSSRAWTLESGVGAGLKIGYSENFDYILGSSERPVQAALADLLHSQDVFYDVGANVGFFSLLASRLVGPDGSVYAFEPVPENAAAIRRNARLNGITNISVFEVAVSDRCGEGELVLSEWNGGASLRAHDSLSTNGSTRGVPLVTLDHFIADQRLRRPSVVKIDVEGAEMEVLRGLLGTISECQPTLVYEVDEADAVTFATRRHHIDGFVASMGYHVRHLADSYPHVDWCVGHAVAEPIANIP